MAMLFTMAVWGFSPVFIHSLSVGLGPADALVIRYAISAAFFLLVMALWLPPQIARQDWPRLVLICLAMLGYNLGSVYGFERIGAGVGGLIIGTQPLLIVLLAVGLGLERATSSILIGLALALIGTVALFWSDFQGEIDSGVLKLGVLFRVPGRGVLGDLHRGCPTACRAVRRLSDLCAVDRRRIDSHGGAGLAPHHRCRRGDDDAAVARDALHDRD